MIKKINYPILIKKYTKKKSEFLCFLHYLMNCRILFLSPVFFLISFEE